MRLIVRNDGQNTVLICDLREHFDRHRSRSSRGGLDRDANANRHLSPDRSANGPTSVLRWILSVAVRDLLARGFGQARPRNRELGCWGIIPRRVGAMSKPSHERQSDDHWGFGL